MSNDLFIHQISFIATTSSTISDICRVDCPLLRPPIAFLVMAQTPILDRRQLRGGREAPNVNLVRVSIFSLPLRREAEKPNAFFPSLNKQGSCSSSSPRLRMTDSFPILTPSLSHSLEGDPGTKGEREETPNRSMPILECFSEGVAGSPVSVSPSVSSLSFFLGDLAFTFLSACVN